MRRDQRVMRWFSLINAILGAEKSGTDKSLQVVRYPVIALSPHAGMAAWGDGGVTLHGLISPMVGRALQEVGVDATLTSAQKLEAFREARTFPSVNLLRETLWRRSISAEVWFTQKTNFARSSAVMAVAGHILGLGDRTPFNILVMNDSGRTTHFDFCECFERAQQRAVCPERVPFRLTQMMVSVLGIGGTEGVFAMTATSVMSVMRRKQFCLVACLDVFERDPDDRALDLVREKLGGRELEGVCETPDQQVKRLIGAATDEYNQSQVGGDWMPNW